MTPDRRFRLIVFDWDGTLMDSAANIAACMACSFADVGLPVPPEDQRRAAIGLGLDETLERLCPEAPRSLHLQVIERYRVHWFATYRDASVLFDGAFETIAALRERGYLLAVATGKGRPGLERDLEANGLGRYFQATRTASEGPSKPHPQMLLEILDELGAQAQDTLVVGDTTFDLEMARNAGAAAVAVASGGHQRAALSACKPLAVLGGVVDLPDWLSRTG